jgi:hypothetical protein
MRRVAASWGRGRGFHVLSTYVRLIIGGTELLQDSENAWSVIGNKWVPLHDIVKSPTSPPRILGNGGFATILFGCDFRRLRVTGRRSRILLALLFETATNSWFEHAPLSNICWCKHHDENGVHGAPFNAAAIVAGYPSYEPGSARAGHSEHPLKNLAEKETKGPGTDGVQIPHGSGGFELQKCGIEALPLAPKPQCQRRSRAAPKPSNLHLSRLFAKVDIEPL